MKAEIIDRTRNYISINWSDPSLGFGQLKMTWDHNSQRFIVDSENLCIDSTIRIFKAVKI